MAVTLSTALRTFMLDSAFTPAFNTTGQLNLYAGTRPTTADTTASGSTLLATITLPAAPWVSPSVAGVSTKNGTWTTSSALANGTASWARMQLSTDSGNTGTTDRRMDMNVGTTGSDLNMTTTQITTGSPVTVNTFTVTLPSQ
jgi:hypothetical protein